MMSAILSPDTQAWVRYAVRLRRLGGRMTCERCSWPDVGTRASLDDVAIVGALTYTRRGVRCYACLTRHSVERHHSMGRTEAPHSVTAISANLHRAVHFVTGCIRFNRACAGFVAGYMDAGLWDSHSAVMVT
jgi:hypothetical protein